MKNAGGRVGNRMAYNVFTVGNAADISRLFIDIGLMPDRQIFKSTNWFGKALVFAG
jgi:hypothetical protein